MKAAFLIMLLAAIFLCGKSQEKFPPGCYMSFGELKEHKPSVADRLRVMHEFMVERDSDTITLAYQLLPRKNSVVSKTDIKKNMWAYSNDTNLYINTHLVGLKHNIDNFSNEYARTITNGRFLCFYYDEMQNAMPIVMPLGIAIVAAIAGAIELATTKKNNEIYIPKNWYSIDMNDAKRYYVDSAYVQRVVADYPEIQQKYKNEPDKKNVIIQLYYLDMMNGVKK